MALSSGTMARSVGPPLSTAGRRIVQYLPAALLLIALIGLWEAWVRAFDTRPYILPTPSAIWTAFLETRGTLPEHILTTLNEALLGLAIAAGAGVLIAVLLAMAPFARQVVYPILVVSQTIPMIVSRTREESRSAIEDPHDGRAALLGTFGPCAGSQDEW